MNARRLLPRKQTGVAALHVSANQLGPDEAIRTQLRVDLVRRLPERVGGRVYAGIARKIEPSPV